MDDFRGTGQRWAELRSEVSSARDSDFVMVRIRIQRMIRSKGEAGRPGQRDRPEYTYAWCPCFDSQEGLEPGGW